MEDIHLDSDDRPKMIIEAFNKKCEITPFLSLADMTIVKNMMNSSREHNFLDMVANIIAIHTEGILSKTEILFLEDNTINRYIELCASSDAVLQGIFNGIDVENYCEKFILAVLKYSDHFEQQHSNLYRASLSAIQTQLSSVTKNLVPAMEPMLEVSRIAASIVSSSQEIWKNSFEPLVNAITNIFDYSSFFKSISDSLTLILKGFAVPSLSKKEKKRLIAAYQKWGEYGWTLPLDVGISTLSVLPSSLKEANDFFVPYTTKSKMNELFIVLSKMKRIKKSDLQEAIACFNEKHYKSCAMILFSMMDARLIRLQDKAEEGEMRPSGIAAAQILFKRIRVQSIDQDVFYTLLNHRNILSALESVFKGGKDFKVQPDIINRNFLDHGMLHRRVSRQDCCKLFLLLYNFTLYLNDYIDNT